MGASRGNRWILNPPQVGILGVHKIADRPVAVNGQIVLRPMMYLALSYDHRIVDGREAVQFLAQCEAEGTTLVHCPAYIREWIEREKVQP